jgi:hypothetical protein
MGKQNLLWSDPWHAKGNFRYIWQVPRPEDGSPVRVIGEGGPFTRPILNQMIKEMDVNESRADTKYKVHVAEVKL